MAQRAPYPQRCISPSQQAANVIAVAIAIMVDDLTTCCAHRVGYVGGVAAEREFCLPVHGSVGLALSIVQEKG